MIWQLRILSPVLLLILIHAADAVDRVEGNALRQAVKKGLVVIERGGTEWIEERKCASCHQIPAMLWSMHSAQEQGLFTEKEKLAKWSDWSLQWENWDKPEKAETEAAVASKNTETMANLILAGAVSQESSEGKALLALWSSNLLKNQKGNGSWDPKGQLPLQKRSKEESRQATTMWSLLAIEATGVKSDAVTKSRARAMGWLAKSKEGKSTEWWVARYLVERQFGNEKKAEQYLKGLVLGQNADGGWGWLLQDKSDAFGTGLALHALGQAKWKTDNPVIVRAHRFLVKTQKKDGSWPVLSTLKRHSKKVIPTSEHWGTSWGVIGLLATMDKK